MMIDTPKWTKETARRTGGVNGAGERKDLCVPRLVMARRRKDTTFAAAEWFAISSRRTHYERTLQAQTHVKDPLATTRTNER